MASALWPAVESLFAPCRPAAVARFVVAVIVDAVNGVLWRRALPHVGKEGRKAVPPALADGDSSAAIARVIRGLRIVTSLNDVAPRGILHRPEGETCLSVLSTACRNEFASEAAATPDMASREIATEKNSLFAAIAHASPQNGAVVIAPCFRVDKKPSETLADQVKLRGHREITPSGVARTTVIAVRPLSFYLRKRGS